MENFYPQKNAVGVIGAGIAGLTAAIALKKAGIPVRVYEAAPEIKPVGAGLALASNAMKALQKLGIAESVIAAGRLLPHFAILDKKGKVLTKVDTFGIDNFLIHRSKLHSVLLSHLGGDVVQTNKRAVAVDRFADGSAIDEEILIAADGINSAIRRQLVPKAEAVYAGYTCWRAIVHAPDLKLEGATETWDVAGRFGIAPLSDGDVYWFACINAPVNSFRHFTIADLQQRFKGFHTPVASLIERTTHLLHNDIYDISPLARYAYGNVLLIGDAAHAATPNMGQGACQAIEDAVVLADEWMKHVHYKDAFKAFEQRRLARTHYVMRQSKKIGAIAQISNPVLATLRNAVMRNMPRSLQEQQYAKIYQVDF